MYQPTAIFINILCQNCQGREIKHPKWGLCDPCYQRERKAGLINTHTKRPMSIIEKDRFRQVKGVCWGCRKVEIPYDSSGRKQCGYCSRFYRRGFPSHYRSKKTAPTLIYLGPLPHSPFMFRPYVSDEKAMQCALLRKYGTEIFDDFDLITSHYAYDLNRISKKYGFTRERMRQIYTKATGLTGTYVGTTKTKKAREDAKAMVCVSDPRHRLANNKTKNSCVYKGAKAELLFMETAQKKGFTIAPACSRSTDFVVNNKKVEVKSSYSSQKSPRAKTAYFRYPVTPNEMNMLDFVAAYHIIEKAWFIIPRSEIAQDRTGSGTVYLLEQKSNYRTAKNRYWEYRDAWHLL